MAWTTKPPTDPGWWGWRADVRQVGEPVEVFFNDHPDGGLWGNWPYRPSHIRVDSIGGQWWDEPIKLPWEDAP